MNFSLNIMWARVVVCLERAMSLDFMDLIS